MLHRLSSMTVAVRGWCAGIKAVNRRYQTALAANRHLRNEAKALNAKLLASELSMSELNAMTSQQNVEIESLQKQIGELESQVNLNQTEIKGMAKINAALFTDVDKLIAQHVAAASRATVVQTNPTEGLI
jgi:SMC interacting uncharacterized protein involved in chromosome segregation